MEALATHQETLGEDIQRIIRNYKKDPSSRKTRTYYEERLKRLEELWQLFETNDTTIREKHGDQLNHNYFASDYYSKIQSLYNDFHSEFQERVVTLENFAGQEERLPISEIPVKTGMEKESTVVVKPNQLTSNCDQSVFTDTQSTRQNPNTNEALEKVIRLQKVQMESLNHLIDRLMAPSTNIRTQQYIETKKQYLEHLWQQIEQYHLQVWSMTAIPEEAGYDTRAYLDLEDKYQMANTFLAEELHKLHERTPDLSILRNQGGTVVAIPTSTLKLPKIELPKFDGTYLKWRQFHDLFRQMVHSQPMGDCQKMWYLKANVSGEAEKLIRHFSLSDSNYTAAWNVLVERYDNTRLLATSLLNKLLSQSALTTENAQAIKTLHDTTRECILGLENIGISTTSWDPILTHITLKKLDRTTHNLYEQTLQNPRELQPLKELLKFLETRFQSLEALGNKVKGASPTAKSLTSVSKVGVCIVCKGSHQLFCCPKFLEQGISERIKTVKRSGLCFNCLRIGHSNKNCTSRGCTKCGKKHNSLLHLTLPSQKSEENKLAQLPTTTATPSNQSSFISSSAEVKRKPSEGISCYTIDQRGYVMLGTVIVNVLTSSGTYIKARALLDSGSQINFITAALAKTLGLQEFSELMYIEGIGSGKRRAQRRVNIQIQSRVNNFCTRIEAFVLPRITADQPTHTIDISTWHITETVQLADPLFHQPDRIDLLIGAELYYELLSDGQIKLGQNLPLLQNTRLGWVVSGKVGPNHKQDTAICGICTEEETIEQQLDKFWKLEEVDNSSNQMSENDRKCDLQYEQTTQRDRNGRFIVRLPFSDHPTKLGKSKEIAIRRLFSIERKLNRDSNLKQQYIEFMKEYIRLGHMEEVEESDIPEPCYYLPHHFVLKLDSTTTKLRVVFDASTKTSTNLSLNNILYDGPILQDELFTIVLRFRMPRFVFTADIEKMYRQIIIHEDDRRYQLIVWREDDTQQIKTFRLNTVTYGTRSAPYLATKCLQKLAHEEAIKYPLGSQILLKDFYMDDVMTGADSLNTAKISQTELINLLASGGFRLRKWSANHPALLESFPPGDVEVNLDKTSGTEDQVKTLGLVWRPKSDTLEIRTTWKETCLVTKRTAYSDIAHLFDPLGIMGPVVVTAKIFLQHLWTLKVEWDEPLAEELATTWLKYKEGLKTLNTLQLSRHIFNHQPSQNFQIHIFADASEKAYGAAAYIRTVTKNGRIVVNLLCAKSRVAPTKVITLPRLELCAAKLAADLSSRIKKDLTYEGRVFFWSDSEIVLSWIHSPSKSFQTFVANRISSIQEQTLTTQWRHVPSKHNPADILSRGIPPEKFKECTLWLYGPLFLHGDESIWPPEFIAKGECSVERKRTALTTWKDLDKQPEALLEQINHKNSYKTLQRVVAYVLRFATNVKTRKNHGNQWLTTEELAAATQFIIKAVQGSSFREDLDHLHAYKELSRHSQLEGLNPFIDKNGILRVGGRVQEAPISYDAKHQILLPYNHYITKLIMQDIHLTYMHVGPQGLWSITRQRYWPIKGKSMARSIVHHCVQCSKAKPRLLGQLMGNLPKHRVQPARPFINAGVDFCGPIWTHYKLRGKRPQKSYIAVFCCFATKAIHMELVTDLSTDGFLGALKRFVGRRGYCKNIYSDNATNFIGAKNKLKEVGDIIQSRTSVDQITKACSEKGIEFHFMPPRAPHFGGLWEAAVKSAKYLLERTIGSASLTYEELETVVIEAEAILNSRPLTQMSNNPNDFTALTPAHFLTGEPLTQPVDPEAEPMRAGLLTRWKLVKHIQNEFWRRWSKEYLCELQERHKWKKSVKNIKEGQMVMVKEDNLPPLKWVLGRVVQPIKGSDGLVRVAEIRTAKGVFKRPIHKLAPLPVEEDDEGSNGSASSNSNSKDDRENSGQDQSRGLKENKRTANKGKRECSEVPPKRTRGSTVTSLSAVLLTCLVLPIFAPVAATQFEINPFQSQSGIYFENLGITHIISNEWKLVVYYNTTLFWREYEVLVNGTKSLASICDQMKMSAICSNIVTQFQQLINELDDENEILRFTPGQHRIKRAPLNIVGNIASALFGVLDSEYAEKMAQTINELEDNQEQTLQLLKDQTSLIDSTVNIMRRDHEVLAGAIKHITLLETNVKRLGIDVHQTTVLTLFLSLSVQLGLIAMNFRRAQSSLTSVLIDSHQGRIRPELLSPHQLRTELSLIKDFLPATLRLPTSIDNLSEIYKLLTIEGRVTRNHIIFQLKLPLLVGENFELFRVIPIPVSINNTFLTIKPSTPYLVVNLHRDQYYPIGEQELSKCTRIEEDSRLCRQTHPIYQKGASTSACEIDLMNSALLPTSCEFTISQNVTEWIQLFEPNAWIYSFKNNQTINIVCGKTSSRITLDGTGILRFESDCIIKQKYVTIQGHNIFPTSTRVSYTPTLNLVDTLIPTQRDQLLMEPMQFQEQLEELQELQTQLAKQREGEDKATIRHHDLHQYTISYGSLSLLVIVIIYLGWQHRIRNFKPTPQPRKNPPNERFKIDVEP